VIFKASHWTEHEQSLLPLPTQYRSLRTNNKEKQAKQCTKGRLSRQLMVSRQHCSTSTHSYSRSGFVLADLERWQTRKCQNQNYTCSLYRVHPFDAKNRCL